MPEQSLLYQEIHEQPNVLATLIDQERAQVEQFAVVANNRKITHVVIAARGTSDNAARYAQYLWGAVNGLPVALATPSLHTIYQRPPRYRDALVVGISQSGQSPDIVSVVAEGKRQGALTVAITNTPQSPLAQAADFVVPLHAGPEQSVAATKTYTSELLALALLSAALADDQAMFSTLAQLPAQVAQTLALAPAIAHAAERYRYMRVCVVIGRGFNYATAFELALKIKELTYIVAEPYSSADFQHGPIALIEDAFPTVVLAPSGVMLSELQQFIGVLKERGAEVIVISDDDQTLNLARTPLKLPIMVPEWVSPMVSIVAGQLLALYLAQVRDYDVDRPRGLRKVTETR